MKVTHIAGIIALSTILAACGGSDSPKDTKSATGSTDAKTEAKADAKPTKATINVTADVLTKDYEDNEVAANSKYKDKTVVVTGVIDSIAADITDEPLIHLKSKVAYGMNNPMVHLIKEDQAKAVNLKKGKSITVECTSVNEIAGSPDLSDCKIK